MVYYNVLKSDPYEANSWCDNLCNTYEQAIRLVAKFKAKGRAVKLIKNYDMGREVLDLTSTKETT